MAEANSVAMPAARNARFCMTVAGTRALSPARRSMNREAGQRNRRQDEQEDDQRRGPAEVERPIEREQQRQQSDGKDDRPEIVDSCRGPSWRRRAARPGSVMRTAAAATGRLTKKIQRHPTVSVSRPPSNGPTALPNPAAPRMTPPASPALLAAAGRRSCRELRATSSRRQCP